MALSLPPTLEPLRWLLDMGMSERELLDLNSCVPGEFTLPEALYVNSATPNVIYGGTTEGTLPLVAGRWYSIPEDAVARHASLSRERTPIARAVRLAR